MLNEYVSVIVEKRGKEFFCRIQTLDEFSKGHLKSFCCLLLSFPKVICRITGKGVDWGGRVLCCLSSVCLCHQGVGGYRPDSYVLDVFCRKEHFQTQGSFLRE